MPQYKKKSNQYLQRFKQTRQIGSYNFDLDLRKVKDDSQLTPAQKSRITRVYSEYSEIAKRHGNDSIKLIKPRKHKGETEKQYQRRFKKLQKENAPDFKTLNVIPLGVPADSNYKIVDNKIIVKRKRSKLQEYYYSIHGDLKLQFMDNATLTIMQMVRQHNDKHPKHPALLVGLATNGYPWKMGSSNDLESLCEDFELKLLEYKNADNSVDISAYVSHLLIRG